MRVTDKEHCDSLPRCKSRYKTLALIGFQGAPASALNDLSIAFVPVDLGWLWLVSNLVSGRSAELSAEGATANLT